MKCIQSWMAWTTSGHCHELPCAWRPSIGAALRDVIQRAGPALSTNRRDKSKASLLVLLALFTAMLSSAALSDDKRKPVKIGELWFADALKVAPFRDAFREGLAELGYVDGRSATLVTRYANGDAARIPSLLAELIAQNVDIMFVAPRAALDAKRATKKIPIVTAGLSDAVAEGVAISMARPGGNLTGTSWQSPETSGKRLELLMEVMPGLKRIALLFDASDSTGVVEALGTREVAARVRFEFREFRVQAAPDFEAAFKSIEAYRPDAIVLTATGLMLSNVDRIVQFAHARKLPIISEIKNYATAGVLFTYGPDPVASFKRAAYYVDRILKGAKPGDLPIEQPTKFELVVNLKTAKALGIKIPESIMLRADEVIR